MDPSRFDTLTRSLSDPLSRRGALATLLGSALALRGLADAQDVAAKDCKKIPNKKKRKTCLKKTKQTTDRTPVSPPGPTCTDGATNGSETDVDCGGGCPRCALDRTCTSRNDCVSAFCKNNTCQPCAANPECDRDINGACFCRATGPAATGGSMVCHTGVPTGDPVLNCTACAPGTYCISAGGAPEIFTCRKPCGAA